MDQGKWRGRGMAGGTGQTQPHQNQPCTYQGGAGATSTCFRHSRQFKPRQFKPRQFKSILQDPTRALPDTPTRPHRTPPDPYQTLPETVPEAPSTPLPDPYQTGGGEGKDGGGLRGEDDLLG